MLSEDEKENEVGGKIAAAGAVECMYTRTYLTVLKRPQLRIRGKYQWQSRVSQCVHQRRIRGNPSGQTAPSLAGSIIEGHQMQSDAIGGNQSQSETMRGNQRQSEAISCNRMQSEAIRGQTGPWWGQSSNAIRCNQSQSEPIRANLRP